MNAMRSTRDLLLVWCVAAATFTLGALVASCEPTRDLTAVEPPQEQPSAAALVSADSANVLGVGSDELLYVAPGAGERGPRGEKGEPGPHGPPGVSGIGLTVKRGGAPIGGEYGVPPWVHIEFDAAEVDVGTIVILQCYSMDDVDYYPVPCNAYVQDPKLIVSVDLRNAPHDIGSVTATLVGTFD